MKLKTMNALFVSPQATKNEIADWLLIIATQAEKFAVFYAIHANDAIGNLERAILYLSDKGEG